MHRFYIDRGGTFTDCLAVAPDGTLGVHKLPSDDRAPLTAVERALGLPEGAPSPPLELRIGSTVATNALLERRGVPSALVVTRGFGDVIEIGTQARPELFRLDIEKPRSMASAVLEVAARAAPDGSVLETPDLEALETELAALRARGLHSAAVVLLHGHRAPALERGVGEVCARAGFGYVVLSHELSVEAGFGARADTTLLDAHVTPLVRAHLAELSRALPGARLLVMRSSGTLAVPEAVRGTDAVLSGPAGGVVAAARIAEMLGAPAAIGFDMGGTSTDVSRVDAGLELVHESEVGGVRLRSPMLRVHTVAAGGGSVCRVRDGRLEVGPESVGARPGPLAYGALEATEIALTDCDLVLGRLRGERFPQPLDVDRARRALDAQARAAGYTSPETLAEAFVAVADATMADAIARVTTARGHDPRSHALVAFGGAAGQHAVAVARRLGVTRVLLHPLAGVLSAWGIALAEEVWHGAVGAHRVPLTELALAALAPRLDELETAARAALGERDPIIERTLELASDPSEASVELPWAPLDELVRALAAAQRARDGFVDEAAPIVVVTARLRARAPEPTRTWKLARTSAPPLPAVASVWLRGREREVPLVAREALAEGARRRGPLLVLEATGSVWVDEDCELAVLDDDVIELRVSEPRAQVGPDAVAARVGGEPALARDPASLAVMGGAFMAIAEQMGEALRRTARSTNIKHRLDFSCALFDRKGRLVANAPHVPVHLGAMSASVRAVLARHPDPHPGDAFVTNDPAAGGSHLPDVTVVTPVFDGSGARVAIVACRGHHADVGGTTPGSMPPFATRLDEEGVVLRAERLLDRGRLCDAEIGALLGGGPLPARRVDENLADLRAQLAANQLGATRFLELSEREGVARVQAYLAYVQDDARECVERLIATLPPGEHRFEDALDDDTPIVVTLSVVGARLRVDFTGTSPPHPQSLNAPRAVTVACLLYVLRCLVGRPIPLNDGCLDPIDLVIPRPSLLDPPPGAAVSGGNVETSQRVVDVLLGALGAAAASQGTMNNLSFGDASFGYYETIAGGAGAGPAFHGASGVHTHMTNTRITDAELLEARYPVRVERFALRRGSGGDGEWRGGDGLVRELRFLRDVTLSLVAERRRRAPWGLAGGGAGAPGRDHLDGELLPSRVTREVRAGQLLCIETPGGGGWGATLTAPTR